MLIFLCSSGMVFKMSFGIYDFLIIILLFNNCVILGGVTYLNHCLLICKTRMQLLTYSIIFRIK